MTMAAPAAGMRRSAGDGLRGWPLSIVVIGASGDLAQRKIYPALFALYCQGLIPEPFHVFGYARTEFELGAFREHVARRLTCRYTPASCCGKHIQDFLSRCHYVRGGYDGPDGFLDLYQEMKIFEREPAANRLYYLALPPAVYLDVMRGLGAAGLVSCGAKAGWSRVVVEKPFGRDRASSDRLVRDVGQVFQEDEVYRIDHYLGKEAVQNLMVLRFGNRLFEPLWNREHVSHVLLTWKEAIGVEGRGGYFDENGIVRDVMQNHLLQILALAAMEPPARADANAVRDEKVRLLRAVAPVTPAEAAFGQYGAGEMNGRRQRGYLEEEKVAPHSRTPTSAAVALRVRNDRWEGVPFFLFAGKALDKNVNELRIRFRETPFGLVERPSGWLGNELIIRIQPDEAIELRMLNKAPGLRMTVQPTTLDLKYRAAFKEVIPDAYERLLLDVIAGDRSLFIRADELAAAWDVFTPLLQAWDEGGGQPEVYSFGTPIPDFARRLANRHGIPLE